MSSKYRHRLSKISSVCISKDCKTGLLLSRFYCMHNTKNFIAIGFTIHTCFDRIELPRYPSKEVLIRKIMQAIEYVEMGIA
jgi:hypothetical protein